jgi:hypothetical protein
MSFLKRVVVYWLAYAAFVIVVSMAVYGLMAVMKLVAYFLIPHGPGVTIIFVFGLIVTLLALFTATREEP